MTVKELCIALAGEDRDVTEVLQQLKKVSSVPIHVEHLAFEHLKEGIMRTSPNLLIYDGSGKADLVQKAAASTSQMFLDIPWAVVSDTPNADTILQFFRMGAIDFLKRPVQTEDVKRL